MMTTFTTSIQYDTKAHSHCNKVRKNKIIRKKDVKLSLANGMIFYIEKSVIIWKITIRINGFSKVTVFNLFLNQLHCFILANIGK